jgi:hypothetical protein
LLPIDTVAPLPLLPEPAGHGEEAVELAVGELPPEFPPPHAARIAVVAAAMPAKNLRFMSVFLRMINR